MKVRRLSLRGLVLAALAIMGASAARGEGPGPIDRTIVGLYDSKTDLTLRLPTDGNDELTQVAHSFNRLVEAAHRVTRSMAKASQRISSTSDSLGQITEALYKVGGQYRRSM